MALTAFAFDHAASAIMALPNSGPDKIASGCKSPVNFTDQGNHSMSGPVTLIPMFWWNDSPFDYLDSDINHFYKVLEASDEAADYWGWVRHEYNGPSLQDYGAVWATGANGGVIKESDIQDWVQNQIETNSIPYADHPLYIVHMPTGTRVMKSDGTLQCTGSPGWNAFNGWKTVVPGTINIFGIYTYSFVIIPDLTDPNCAGSLNGGSVLDATTRVESHEIAEAITDLHSGGWRDNSQPSACGSEIADLCANDQTTIVTPAGTAVVQKLWSNLAQACVTFDTTNNNLTSFSRGTTATPGSALDGYWGVSDNSQHVNFIDVDNHVHELYIHNGASWVDNDLSQIANATAARPDSPLDGYWGLSDNSQHVNFIDENGHINELYIHNGANWIDNDLSEIASGGFAPRAPQNTAALDGYWGVSDNSQHVNYIDTTGHVRELYIHNGANWVDNDLTTIARGTVASLDTRLDGYWGTSDNSQHVNFVDGVGHVHELYIHNGANWVDNDLTKISNGVIARAGSAIHGYWGSDNSQHVNFFDGIGHVHELYIHNGANWIDNDLTMLSFAPPAAATSAIDGYWGGDSSQHVHFVDGSGHVQELYIRPGLGWFSNDLSSFAGGTTAVTTSALDGYWLGANSSQHINYLDSTGNIHELYQ
jgi:hypothetical protein